MNGQHHKVVEVRRQLNQGQLAVLLVLFRFRYGSRELVAVSLGKKNGTAMHSKLTILLEQEYIGRRYERGFQAQNRPAAYYLTPKGLRALRDRLDRDDIDDVVIKASYKDKTATQQFIDHNLSVFAAANQFKALYPELMFFTKRELLVYDYFPKPLPDGYISLKSKQETKRFFVEILEASMPYMTVEYRIRQYVEYYQDGIWQAKGNPFPPILCICEDAKLERRVTKQIAKVSARTGEDMDFYVTTRKALAQASDENLVVWSRYDEPDELIRF